MLPQVKMFSKRFHFVILTVIFLLLQGAACFFVKHVQTGMCIHVTRIIHRNEYWGNLSFVELSNNCLDPAAQSRFLDNSAMFNLERKSCFEGTRSGGTGYNLPMLYMLVTSNPSENCRNTDHAITQTSWGGLFVYYFPTKRTRCAVLGKDDRLATNQGIDPYIRLTTDCNDAENKRFNFGSVTCHGNMTKNANCPKDQYMVVKTASYRGLSPIKTCGLSDDYSCEVDATCLVKKQCDGLHECNITVDDNLFSGDPCPGLTKYLYFEYQCINTPTPSKEICVDGVSLSYSSLPNEGFVKSTTDSGIKNVCWQSLGNAKDVVCRQLGYKQADSLVEKAAPSDLKDEKFSGSIACNDGDTKLSQCSVTTSSQSCSTFSYLKCHICPRPLLGEKQRFPDSSFTASASSKGRSPSDARISSGSSWCAPVSDDKHYLEVDLGRLYIFYYVAIFGDSTSSKWVVNYNLNYTVDLIKWGSVSPTKFTGNKNAYNDAAIQDFSEGTRARALRFIPLSYVGQPCMRIEICGATLLPNKPTNLTVTNIKSRSADISWLNPDNTGDGDLTGFWIKLKKENSLTVNTTTDKVNKYKLQSLTPYTVYKLSVAAGNKQGFGEETITSFLTSEEAPSGPPLNIKTTSRSTSSLSFTWDPPEKDKQNGIITSYTGCVSQSENGPCFQTFITSEREWLVRNLNASTKYYVRVLASNKAGSSVYSGSKGFFTNGRAGKKASEVTSSTLTFSLEIPSKTFLYFYVVALKLKDDKEPTSSDSYENSELVTYAEARKSTNPKPYIAAVVASSGVDENMFILGDGRNTSDPTSRRRRSTSSDYYNGPLEPGTSYSIFQRIVLNEKSEYYSTDWSPPSKTNEYTGGPRVLTKISSGDIKAKEGDLVNLLCSAQGEPPITFSWEKDQKSLESLVKIEQPHRSSFLVVTVKDETSFGKYICHIQDRFQSTTHTIWIQKLEDTGKDENDDGSKKYLAGIIVLVILVIILLVILAYFIYQIRRLKSSKANPENKSRDRNNSKDIYENPDKDDANYEQVENEQSTYTALKRTGKDENDDHLYSHLDEVHKDYVNQKETGI